MVQQRAAKYPGYAAAVENAFNIAKAKAEASAARKFGEEGDTIFRIPVVFHVVHNTSDQNLDDSLMLNQIEVLNQDFRRQNADTGNTRNVFKSVAADAGIEFFLASEDPNGNATTGITRTSTNIAAFSALGFGGTPIDSVKKTSGGGITAWDTDRYLNIWICNIEDIFGQVLGFAYPPEDAPNFPNDSLFPTSQDTTLHGIVIHYAVFGRNNPLAVDSPFNHSNRGRTVVHEVGHYMGLAHIWGNVTFFDPDGCLLDDGVADTPNSADNSQQAGCDLTKNTCHDDVPDMPDMFENYMDYSKEECQNVFTQGQVGVMRATLTTSRKELPQIYVVPPVNSGIGNVGNAFSMNVYPNPAQDKINILFGTEKVQQIILSDLVGKTWMTLTEPAKNTTLDVSSLPTGVYTVTAQSVNGMAVKKVVVE